MHVNARSSNHDPNHVLDRDPKRLSERDSSPCEHSLCLSASYACTVPILFPMQTQVTDRVKVEEKKCAMCSSNPAEITLVPCGHRTICKGEMFS